MALPLIKFFRYLQRPIRKNGCIHFSFSLAKKSPLALMVAYHHVCCYIVVTTYTNHTNMYLVKTGMIRNNHLCRFFNLC